MEQTPITKSIEQIRIQAEDYRKRGNYEQNFMLIHKSESLFDSINLLQSLLPYERECFVETYYDGGIRSQCYGGVDIKQNAQDYFTSTYNNDGK